MSHCVSNMIGVRVSGVFGGPIDMEALKARIAAIVMDMKGGDDPPYPPAIDDDPSHCLSGELVARKGSYVVIAGVFNYWTHTPVKEFAIRLSRDLGTDVMVMSWDEEADTVQCNVFAFGEAIFDMHENPIGKILRRVV